MNVNAGIITEKLNETKTFYADTFGWQVVFENDFYLLMESPGGGRLSFLLPNHPSQDSLFQPAFGGTGVYLTIEVPDVDAEYARIKACGRDIAISLRDEAWGDRHFAIVDPNGIGVDIITYTAPST